MADGDKPVGQRIDEIEASLGRLGSGLDDVRAQNRVEVLVASEELKKYIEKTADSHLLGHTRRVQAFLLLVPPILGTGAGWLFGWQQKVKVAAKAVDAVVEKADYERKLRKNMDEEIAIFLGKFEDTKTNATAARKAAAAAKEKAGEALAIASEYVNLAGSKLLAASKAEDLINTLGKAHEEIVSDVSSRVMGDAMVEGGAFSERVVAEVVERINDGLPVGTIVAWPGAIPDMATKAGKAWHERWRLCAGGTHPVTGDADPLYLVLSDAYDTERHKTHLEVNGGVVALPDFQGMFLRGVGGSAKAIGMRQSSSNLEHQHHMFTNADSEAEAIDEDSPITKRGLTKDALSYSMRSDFRDGAKATLGLSEIKGEKESRPVNYAVHWIIRVK